MFPGVLLIHFVAADVNIFAGEELRYFGYHPVNEFIKVSSLPGAINAGKNAAPILDHKRTAGAKPGIADKPTAPPWNAPAFQSPAQS